MCLLALKCLTQQTWAVELTATDKIPSILYSGSYDILATAVQNHICTVYIRCHTLCTSLSEKKHHRSRLNSLTVTYFNFRNQWPRNCHIYLVISPESSSQSSDTVRRVSGNGPNAVTQVVRLSVIHWNLSDHLFTWMQQLAALQAILSHFPFQAITACVIINNRAMSVLKMHRVGCDHILYSTTIQHFCISKHSTITGKEALCCNSLGQPFKLTSNNRCVNI